jgi:hypothetical protein
MDSQDFTDLSVALTGVSEDQLPAKLKRRVADGQEKEIRQIYLDRLQASYAAGMEALSTAWQAAKAASDPVAELDTRLRQPDAQVLRQTARQVIKIWYLTIIDDPNNPKNQLPGDLGQYQLGIAWNLISAHAPAYSFEPHGYWSAKPQ